MRLFFFLILTTAVQVLLICKLDLYMKDVNLKNDTYTVDIIKNTPDSIQPEPEPEVQPEVEPDVMPQPVMPEPVKPEPEIQKIIKNIKKSYTKGGNAPVRSQVISPVRAPYKSAGATPSHLPPTPMQMPKINLPQSQSQQNYSISMPKVNLGKAPQVGKEDVTDKALLSQLDSQAAARYGKNVVDTTGAESIGKSSSHSTSNNFFVIKNLGGSRKLISVPEKPSFSLTASTSVRASFKVDRDGNTYAILLLNRTDSKIERLAIDFIQKLKFNAALSDQSEPAEIILNFRVK